MSHYHVLGGLRGLYMPDSNDVHSTLADAREAAAIEAEAWSEAHELPVEKRGADYYVIGQFCVEVSERCDANCEEVDHE